jgi:hypothetical protein
LNRIKQITAIALSGSLILSTARPAKSQAQVLAPLACATGVGCVLIGAATVGGIVYYIWQNQQTGKKHYNTIDDPEAEQVPEYDEPVIAASPEEANRICQQKARANGVEVSRVQMPSRIRPGNNQIYRCWFKFVP